MEDLKKILELTNVDLVDFKESYGALHKVSSCLGLQIANEKECDLCRYNIPCEAVTSYFNSKRDKELIIKVLQRYYEANKKEDGIISELESIKDDTGVTININEIIPDYPITEEAEEVKWAKEAYVPKKLEEQLPKIQEIRNNVEDTKLVDDSLLNKVLLKLLNGELSFNIKIVGNDITKTDQDLNILEKLQVTKEDEFKEDKFDLNLDEKIEGYINTRKRGFKKKQILTFLQRVGCFISELELDNLLSVKTSIYFDAARGIYKLVKKMEE